MALWLYSDVATRAFVIRVPDPLPENELLSIRNRATKEYLTATGWVRGHAVAPFRPGADATELVVPAPSAAIAYSVPYVQIDIPSLGISYVVDWRPLPPSEPEVVPDPVIHPAAPEPVGETAEPPAPPVATSETAASTAPEFHPAPETPPPATPAPQVTPFVVSAALGAAALFAFGSLVGSAAWLYTRPDTTQNATIQAQLADADRKASAADQAVREAVDAKAKAKDAESQAAALAQTFRDKLNTANQAQADAALAATKKEADLKRLTEEADRRAREAAEAKTKAKAAEDAANALAATLREKISAADTKSANTSAASSFREGELRTLEARLKEGERTLAHDRLVLDNEKVSFSGAQTALKSRQAELDAREAELNRQTRELKAANEELMKSKQQLEYDTKKLENMNTLMALSELSVIQQQKASKATRAVWGSAAITSTGQIFVVPNQIAEKAARTAALGLCKFIYPNETCSTAATFQRQCFAVARVPGSQGNWSFGYATGANALEAETMARQACRSRTGTNCIVVLLSCSPDDLSGPN